MATALQHARDLRFLAFLANFGLGKGIAFFGPILLGLILSSNLYSGIEFGLSVAQLGSMVATAGIPYATMQLVLIRRGRRVIDLLAVTTAAASAIALIILPVAGTLGAAPHWMLAIVLLAVCTHRECGVAFARTYGRPNLNVWIDHAPTLAIVAVAFGLAVIGRRDDIATTITVLIVLDVLVIAKALRILWRERGPGILARLKEASAIGLPMLGTALIGTWMMSSGRVYLGLLLWDADVYAYAFTFRVMSSLVVLHGIVITAFAAQLYKMPSRKFDPIGASLIGVLAAATVLLILIAPELHLAAYASPAKLAILQNRPATALVGAQVFFWVAGATVEMRVARARLASVTFRLNVMVTLSGIAVTVGLWNLSHLDFAAVAIILLIQQIAGCATQHWTLCSRGVPLRRTMIMTLAGGAAVVATAGVATMYSFRF
jgi:hypothetical protein